MFKPVKSWALCTLLFAGAIDAAEYKIDTADQHAFIQFRVKHLGYSWLYGRFKDFEGDFIFDEQDPLKNRVKVVIDINSLDTDHAKRNEHLLSSDYLDAKQYPQASFESTHIDVSGDTARITGELTLHGVTRPITINAQLIGQGDDPWGGYRAGFKGNTTLRLHDFNIDNKDLGGSPQAELMLDIEGVRQ